MRTAWLERTLPSRGDVHDFVLARVEMNFRHEIRLQHVGVDVLMRVGAVGRTSVTIDHEIRLIDGTVAADGRTVLVAWDEEQRRPRPLTDADRARRVASLTTVGTWSACCGLAASSRCRTVSEAFASSFR